MEISKSAYYALILLRELKKERFVSLPSLSEKFVIPLDFLYKIAAKLKRHKLVCSKEGIHGGFQLVHESVSMDALLEALTTRKSEYCLCVASTVCAKKDACGIYARLQESVHRKLQEIDILTLSQ